MAASIFWYDFETTGTVPARDRPMQVAGIRTNEALEEIGEPLNLYCRLADDILPHPGACLVTGIPPQRLKAEGLAEAQFISRLHDELRAPQTCTAGYNSLRFDDEVMRYSLYRNFYDPYAREWQNGNSRWDLIDVVRTAYALRPEGFVWPEDEGRVTLKLERLSVANGLDHLQAHDALSDVRATIALARLLRQRQPKLYDYLFALRRKSRVQEQVRLLTPLVHVSGRFGAERHFLSVVLPLMWHPQNRNALVVCDLALDPAVLWQEDAATLRQRLYTPRASLQAHELPVPLKLVHVNRCPVLAPLSVLRDEDQRRLGLDLPMLLSRARQLEERQSLWQAPLAAVYAPEAERAACADPEQLLYAGFLGDRDRLLCERVRNAEADAISSRGLAFDDERLVELLFRYRARNFPETLSAAEQQRWRNFCQLRLSDRSVGAPNTMIDFMAVLVELRQNADAAQLQLLAAWEEYGMRLAQKYEVSAGVVAGEFV